MAINAILAIGMTFVILSGGIDLSVGSVAGLCGMIAGGLVSRGLSCQSLGGVVFVHTWLVVAIALAAGMALGAVNGWLVARLRVAPVHRDARAALRGARRSAPHVGRRHVSEPRGRSRPRATPAFLRSAPARWLGLPIPVWLMVVLAAAAMFVATRTPFGRQVYAVGGNERAALLAGVRVAARQDERLRHLGILRRARRHHHRRAARAPRIRRRARRSSSTRSRRSCSAARRSWAAAAPSPGTLIGAFVIGVLADGLVLLGVSEFWQMVIKGLVIVLAVILDQYQKRSS